MTLPEVARRLNLSTHTVRRKCVEGRWPGAKIDGGQWRMRESDVERIARGERVTPREEQTT